MMRFQAALTAICLFSAFAAGVPVSTKRPNILFIITDDQDVLMDSLDYMPVVQKQLIAEGTSFERHFCTGESIASCGVFLEQD